MNRQVASYGKSAVEKSERRHARYDALPFEVVAEYTWAETRHRHLAAAKFVALFYRLFGGGKVVINLRTGE